MKTLLFFLLALSLVVPAAAQDDDSKSNFVTLGMSFNSDSKGVALGYYNAGPVNSLGFYINMALDVTDPVTEVETLDDIWDILHQALDTKEETYIGNVGLTYKTSQYLLIYAGGGIAMKDTLTYWESALESLRYWSYDDGYEYSPNFNIGLIVKPTEYVGIDAGYNSASSGGYVSLAIAF